MIELKAVTKRYGRKGAQPDALRDVTAAVPKGAVWAIVGPNGAGKSTLLSLVLGFIRPTAGEVRIEGESPREYLRARGAAYLPERFRVPDAWTVGAALRLFARLDDAADARAAIERLDLEPHLTKRADELSRGTMQRLGLAQALLARRELVVLDEPTEGLDPIWRIRLRDVLRQLRDDGATILLASHDLAEVERVADRAMVLDRGTVRTVLDTRPSSDVLRYRLRLHEPFADVAVAFPHAVARDATTFDVEAGSAAELSERLGALITLGATVIGVEPVHEPFEERVRETLRAEE